MNKTASILQTQSILKVQKCIKEIETPNDRQLDTLVQINPKLLDKEIPVNCYSSLFLGKTEAKHIRKSLTQEINQLFDKLQRITKKTFLTEIPKVSQAYDALLFEIGACFDCIDETNSYDKEIHSFFEITDINDEVNKDMIPVKHSTIWVSKTLVVVLLNIMEYYFPALTCFQILMFPLDTFYRCMMYQTLHSHKDFIEVTNYYIDVLKLYMDIFLRFRIGPNPNDKTLKLIIADLSHNIKHYESIVTKIKTITSLPSLKI